MSVITNYGELKASIATHIHRTDLTATIPVFVSFAESIISGDPNPTDPEALCGVRTRDQSIRATQVINEEFEDMPTDVLSIRSAKIGDDPIEYLTPDEMTEKFPSSTEGTPRYYSIHGDEFQFKPIPTSDHNLSLTYFQKYTALSADTDTNWLLTNHPLIYVYASCIAGAAFTGDDPSIWLAGYKAMAKSLNSSEDKGRYPSKLVTKINTPTP